MSTIETSCEDVPRVTKSVIKSPEACGYSDQDFTHFENSDTLIFIIDCSLYVSFNGGESWQVVDEFKEHVDKVCLDPFHKRRAFISSRYGDLLVTEDQDRTWKEIYLPGGSLMFPEVPLTHPIDRKLLLYRDAADIAYISNDAGESFSRQIECYKCRFAVSSKESTLESNGIYYTDSGKTYSHALFYTADFGKTIKVFDELKGYSVIEIFTFPSSIVVLTSKHDSCEISEVKFHENKRLWISKGQQFEPVHLPKEVAFLENADYLPFNEDFPSVHDQKRLLLKVKINDYKDHRLSARFLVLDLSNLNFSFWSLALWPDDRPGNCGSPGQLRNLEGTSWGTYYVDSRGSDKEVWATKASFDNGKSWTNLKVVDPSGRHTHLFEENIDDVEQYSSQEFKCASPQNEPTAGIIIKIGKVRKDYISSKGSDMTFISRDGGASWEVAFRFPVYAALLDFGNIIVVVPWESSGVYSKFLFSLDQGRTWDDYLLDESILADTFFIQSLGLKAVIKITRKKDTTEEVFYSLDFSHIFGGAACTEDDLERWYLYDGKCLDGVRYSFDRRKPGAKCLVRKTFEKLELHEERCES